jgi:hypothetical protein
MPENSKKPSEIYVGQPILSQILKYLGKEAVDDIASRHKSDRYVKKLSTYNHLVALLFGVMSFCDSLREIVLLLAAEQRKLRHLSIGYKLSRSTLARANGKRNPKVFESIYHWLLRRYRLFLLDSRQFEPAVKNLYALDSTTVTLATEILRGTGKPSYIDGHAKGGAKAHIVMSVAEAVPCLARITEAATGDASRMGMALSLPKGSFVAMDKAYSSHGMFERFSQRGIFYVTRLKDNVDYKAIRLFHEDGGKMEPESVIRDECVSVSLPESKKRHVCRRIAYLGIVKDRNGKEREKLFVFVTNNLRLPALTVAQIYRNRWQIELLFKRLKHNFPLKYFYGDSANAVKNQIWAALIACLLLTIVHREASAKRKWAFSNMVSLVRGLLMSYVSINLILSDPEMFPNIMFGRPPPAEPDLFSLAGIET